MNELFQTLEHPFAVTAGWALLHSLWLGTMIAGLFALVRFAFPLQSSNARYLAACVALILVAVAPIATAVRLSAQPSVAVAAVESSARTVTGIPHIASTPHRGSEPEFVPEKFVTTLEKIIPWIVAGWIMGVGILSMRLLHGWWWVRRIRRTLIGPVDLIVRERFAELKTRLDISRPVQIFKSALVEVPTVVGWLRPVILLPASSLTGLTPSQLEAVIAHELAHVRRGDYLVNTLQAVIETLMFYHPAVWWISRCVREEREHCCDDLVIEVCGNRADYARALATLETLRDVSPGFAIAATGGSLIERVRRLAGGPGRPAGFGWTQFLGITLFLFGLGFVAVGAWQILAPAQYHGIARIRIETTTIGIGGIQDNPITSRDFLRSVARRWNLAESWGSKYGGGQRLSEEAAVEMLLKRIRVTARTPMVVEIRVASHDPKEAAELANLLAESYRDHVASIGDEIVEARIARWNHELNKYEAQLEDTRSKTEQLRRELKIPATAAEISELAPTLDANAIRQILVTQSALEIDQVRMETQLEKLRRLTPSELENSINTTAGEDRELTALIGQRNELEGVLAVSKTRLTPDHPTMIAQTRLFESLEKRIQERIHGIMLGLENRVDAGRRAINGLQASLEHAKSEDGLIAEKSVPFFEARRRVAEAEAFVTALRTKVATEKIDAEILRSRVTIADRAYQPARPSAPNRILGGVCVGAGMMSAMMGTVLFRRRHF